MIFFTIPTRKFERSHYNERHHVTKSTVVEKGLKDLIDLLKLVGLQLHAIMEDCVSVEKEKLELSTNASQEEGVLKRIEAKVMNLQKIHKGAQNEPRVEVPSNKSKAHYEMERDAMANYNSVVLELNECTSKYQDLETRWVCLRRQFDALSSQIAYVKRGAVGVS